MAWIESHTTLKEHPKLFALMDKLAMTKASAIGHLHLLWWWACDYASDGNLGRYSESQISRAAEWDKDAAAFITALVAVGFLDRRDDLLTIHDWDEFRLYYHASQARREKKREKTRLRVREHRAKKRSGNAPVTHPVTQSNAAKEPNQTKTTERTKPTEPPGFAKFYAVYPKKSNRPDALKAWKAADLSPEQEFTVLSDVATKALSHDWQKNEGQFIPGPAAYLRGRRWEDAGTSLPKPALAPDEFTAAHIAAREAA